MDWSGCELVEGNVSGVALVRGTRVAADSVLESLTSGLNFQQLVEQYPAISKASLRVILDYGVERLGWDDETIVDWSECGLVERVPGRCSGAPTVVGTRIFPDTVAGYYWHGSSVDEIVGDFPSLSRETVLGLIEYVKARELSVA